MSLIFIIIVFAIGFRILFKYFKYKKIEFITIGLTWIFLSSAWWWGVLNFLEILIFNIRASSFLYLILANFFVPWALLSWIYSLTCLIYQNKKKLLLAIFSIICISYEILLIVLLIINPSMIGVEINPNVVSRTALTLSFSIFAIIVAVITGLFLASHLIKSTDQRTKIRGFFLLSAFLLLTAGAALDSFSWTNLIIIAIIRTLLILSSIAYYFGFFLPERIAKLIIKE
ncbi:MAG: hypothetical protein ACTSRH_07980 [Promethearchaeota archaeon]